MRSILTILCVSIFGAACAEGHESGLGTDRGGEPPAPMDPLDPPAAGEDAGAWADDAGAAMPPPPTPTGPLPLRCGRTYDQEIAYFDTTGDVSVVFMFHRDGTSLPAEEGGAPCGDGCEEHVLRLRDGATLSGAFADIQTFNVQGASSSEPGVGTLVVEACGVTIGEWGLHVERASAPGFNNFPSPGWPVPPGASCTFTVRARGGYVDVRAVTTTCASDGEPPPDAPI